MDIACLSRVMVHPSSHKTPNNINGAVLIFGKMWIYFASLIRLGSLIFAICVNSVVFPSGSIDSILLFIVTGSIVGVACLARYIFALESVIAIILILVGLGGVLI